MLKLKLVLYHILLLLSFSAAAQTGSSLPRSTPEAEGVSSADILKFINASEKSKNELHSFMILRHGKVIAEGWWDPYKSSLRHTLYSASKTFTSKRYPRYYFIKSCGPHHQRRPYNV